MGRTSITGRHPVAVAFMVIVALSFSSVPVQAHGPASELDEVSEQIAALNDDLSTARRTHTDLAVSLNETEARMASLRSRLDAANHEVEAAEAELDALRAEMAGLEQTIDQILANLVRAAADRTSMIGRLEREAVEMYMAAASGSSLLVVMTPSAEEAAIAITYLDDSVEESNALVRDLEALEAQEQRDLERLESQRLSLEEATLLADRRRSELEDQYGAVAAIAEQVEIERSRQRGLLAQVDAEIELFESELAGLEREEERLEALLTAEQSGGGSAPGRLAWPVQGRISSLYGYRTHPVTGARRLHSGLDIAAPSGTPLITAASGRVVLADWFGGYGLTVIIDHGGGLATLYAHQSRLAVSAGAAVDRGELIGYVGSTGLSTGPHVHFEVRSGGTAEDPMPWLRD